MKAKSRNGVKLAVRSQLQAIVLAMDCKEGLKPVNGGDPLNQQSLIGFFAKTGGNP